MKYSTAEAGRRFIIRLEDGEILHETIERFAAEQGVTAASLIVLGGADVGSTLVVGPEDGRATPVVPMSIVLENVFEIAGTGTLFPDAAGRPVLHMHIACGRGTETRAGCVRRGVRVWQVMEIVMTELRGSTARRLRDEATGFELLVP